MRISFVHFLDSKCGKTYKILAIGLMQLRAQLEFRTHSAQFEVSLMTTNTTAITTAHRHAYTHAHECTQIHMHTDTHTRAHGQFNIFRVRFERNQFLTAPALCMMLGGNVGHRKCLEDFVSSIFFLNTVLKPGENLIK